MAFNVQTFFTRLGSAAIFCAIMLIGLLTYDWMFMLLFLLVNILCLHEFILLLEKILNTNFSAHEKRGLFVSGVLLFLLVSSIPMNVCGNPIFDFLHLHIFYLLGLFIGAILYFIMFKSTSKAYYLLNGLGYISISLGLLVQMRFQSLLLPVALILLIWMNDTMAYLTGSFVGRTKFFPAISPKKTIEGTVGGIIFTMAFAWVWSVYSTAFSTFHWIVLALIASLIGTIGDLIESKLKRMADVKDSGAMMPGHGGALDRFDSLLFAAPFAFLYALIAMPCYWFRLI